MSGISYRFLGIFLLTFNSSLTLIFAQPEFANGKPTLDRQAYGVVNEVFPVSFAWQENGKTLNGFVYFSNSEDSIAIIGKSNKQLIDFQEWSEAGEKLGKWQLERKNNQWSGIWTGKDKSQEVDLQSEAHTPTAFFIHTKSQGSSAWEVLLSSSGSKDLEGFLFSNIEQMYYPLRGITNNRGAIVMSILDEDQAELGRLQMGSEEASKMALQWQGKQAQFLNISTKRYKKNWTKQINNRIAQIYIYYPLLDHAQFDSWLAAQILPLWKRAASYAEKVQATEFHAGLRNRIQAEGICKITYLDENFVSGRIQYWDNWSGKLVDQTFIFNLNIGLPVALDKIVQKQDDFKRWCKEKLLEKYGTEQNVDFQKWLQQQSLDQWAMRPEGLWLASQQHSIFGQVGLLLSKSELKPYLKAGQALVN